MTRNHAGAVPHSPAPPAYDNYAGDLRRRWGRPIGGPFWDEIEPAFRFGWYMAQDTGLASHTWAAAEADLMAHWNHRQSPSEEMAWDQVRDAVHLAWDTERAIAQRQAHR